jgi:hypothetical protein
VGRRSRGVEQESGPADRASASPNGAEPDRAGDGSGVLMAAADGPPRSRRVVKTAAEGRWTVVVMNADGSRPVAAALAAGVTAPVLRGLWTGLAVGAAVALILGALLVALAVPRRSAVSTPVPA